MCKQYLFLFLSISSVGFAAYNENPQPIIQYKPKPPAQPITSSQDLRTQLANLDKQIQQLAGERDDIRQKATDIGTQADEVLSEYHRLLDAQRQYELDMQQRDDQIAELVRKKAEISRQIKG